MNTRHLSHHGRFWTRLPVRAGALLLAVLFGVVGAAEATTITGVRHSSTEHRTRVVLDLSGKAAYTHRPLANPHRVVVEVPRGVFTDAVVNADVDDGYVQRIRINRLRSGKAQVVLDLAKPLDYSTFSLDNPPRIVVDVPHAGPPLRAPEPTPARRTEADPSVSHRADPPVERDRPAVPAAEPRRGEWVVAIDAGHGGQDHGARHHGTSEKDITLALAKATEKALNRRPGVRAFLVRKGDYYIPLRRRWTLAEKQGADLFVSIHCNASENGKAEGTEVFFLSLKGATDSASRELAQRENAVDEKMGVGPADSDLDEILFDMMQTDVLAKSEMLAETCLDHLFELGTVYNRGVKQAGFAVLKSPRTPSVLVEAAFISNKKENKLLRNNDWQREFGRRLADGLAAYILSVDPQAENRSTGR